MPDRRLVVAGLLMLLAAGCAATPAQQISALSRSGTATDVRARQTRRFDTADRTLVLQASLGALQDLGFTINESNAETGIVVGSKAGRDILRAQVTVRGVPDKDETLVRALFQRIAPRPGAMIDYGETIDDPLLYQGFFERVAQSAFLTANEI
ncbi:MAG: hypothetical protein COY86_02055 [Rhodobacterales bacterium CG_4_10_14_0_8_um_filter_70_9]|nr:MAG: hypothetical protein COY86_02055 [Rhodobacterales bacterium CG_4_10_14_0_8_um_filter_70_9]